MTSPPLTVVHGRGPNRLSRPAAVPRLRPGERPVAVDPELTPMEVRAIRAAARAIGVGVDAYVSVFLEYQSLCDLAGHTRVAALADARRPGVAMSALAPVELQNWQRVLTGREDPPGDDLPEVFIPLRLATALRPSDRVEAVKRVLETDDSEIRRAITLECAAVVSGVVMQTWVLTQLATASGGAPATI